MHELLIFPVVCILHNTVTALTLSPTSFVHQSLWFNMNGAHQLVEVLGFSRSRRGMQLRPTTAWYQSARYVACRNAVVLSVPCAVFNVTCDFWSWISFMDGDNICYFTCMSELLQLSMASLALEILNERLNENYFTSWTMMLFPVFIYC